MHTESAPPPLELKLAWQCERWRTLPENGGLMDQDYQLMQRMNALSNVDSAIDSWKNAGGERIHSLSVHTREILGSLLAMGINFNA